MIGSSSDALQSRILDAAQTVTMPQWHGQHVATPKGLFRLPVDRGTHGPEDAGDRLVVRGFVQFLGFCAGWQPHRVQPNCWHHILGDLYAVHSCSAGERTVASGEMRKAEYRSVGRWNSSG